MCFSPSDDSPLLACGFHSQIPETDSQSVLYLGSHTSRSSNTTTRIIFPGHPFFNHVDPFLRILHLLKIKLKIPRLSFSSPVLTPQKCPPAADLIQSLVFTRLGVPLGSAPEDWREAGRAGLGRRRCRCESDSLANPTGSLELDRLIPPRARMAGPLHPYFHQPLPLGHPWEEVT